MNEPFGKRLYGVLVHLVAIAVLVGVVVATTCLVVRWILPLG